MSLASLNLQSSTTQGVRVLEAEGEIDLFSANRLKAEVDKDTQTPLLLDLSQVNFMDSSGLGAVMSAHKRLSKLAIYLGENPQIERLFEITGTLNVFNIQADREQAISSLAS